MMNDMIISIFINDASPVQFYIVTGGISGSSRLASTEILNKNGGTSWATAASLPTARNLPGVSLPNGHFLVAGEGYQDLVNYGLYNYRRL